MFPEASTNGGTADRAAARRHRATVSGVWLSIRIILAPASRASFRSSSLSTSTSIFIPWGAFSRAASTARAIPPQSRRWLSLMSTMSKSPSRWFEPPPSATAMRSNTRNPGAVFRVSRMRQPVPETASTNALVAVAIPHMRWRRFKATRSAVSTARARPEILARMASGWTEFPAAASSFHESPGSSSSNVRRATERPETTQALRATNRPRARDPDGTVHSVVTSPAPTSSARSSRSFASRAPPVKDCIEAGRISVQRVLSPWSLVPGRTTKDQGLRTKDLRELKHAQERLLGGFSDFFGDHDLGAFVAQTEVELLQGVELHEGALVATAAVVRRHGDVGAVGSELLHLVDDPFLRRDQERLAGRRRHVDQNRARRADVIGMAQDRFRAFRMRGQERAGILCLESHDLALGELLVHDAGARPERHRPPELLRQKGAHVAVGREEDLFLGRDRAHDLLGVGGGHDDVGEGLHGRRAVDVGQRDSARMRLPPGPEGLGRAGILERAAGLVIRLDDLAAGVQDLGGLGHEPDSGEGDDVGVAPLSAPGQVEGIPDEIGEVLDFLFLVVMGQKDCVFLSRQAPDLLCQVQARIDRGQVRRGRQVGWTPKKGRIGGNFGAHEDSE